MDDLPLPRPKLCIPKPSAARYINYYGIMHYKSHCEVLGLDPLTYWAWDEQTRKRGAYWWRRPGAFTLAQVRNFEDHNAYRECVREAFPEEADGERRLFYYVQQFCKRCELNSVELDAWVRNELGGELDIKWCRDVVAHALAG